MLRKVIAGTAVAGALSLGLGVAATAGEAGAATPSSGTPSATLCAKLPKIEARVQKVEGRLSTWLPKVQAREAKLKAEGKTTRADRLAKRVTWIQNRESKVNARLAKVQTACGTTSSSTAG